MRFNLSGWQEVALKSLPQVIDCHHTFSGFNLFNMSNFGNVGGNLANYQQSGTANGTTAALSGADPFNRGALRNGNGSGVFSQGAARVIEYGLKINF